MLLFIDLLTAAVMSWMFINGWRHLIGTLKAARSKPPRPASPMNIRPCTLCRRPAAGQVHNWPMCSACITDDLKMRLDRGEVAPTVEVFPERKPLCGRCGEWLSLYSRRVEGYPPNWVQTVESCECGFQIDVADPSRNIYANQATIAEDVRDVFKTHNATTRHQEKKGRNKTWQS